MPSFKYDDTPRKAYEEPGEYLVTVEEAEWKMSSNGNPMIAVKLRTEGGALVFDNLVFTEKSVWKVSGAMAAFYPSKGIKPPKKDENVDYEERQDWLDEHFVGARGFVLLSKGTSTSGKIRNEVDSYLPPKPGAKPMPAATTPPAPARTSAPATKPTPPAKSSFPKTDPDDDEIPF
jgi:hypothetical protein